MSERKEKLKKIMLKNKKMKKKNENFFAYYTLKNTLGKTISIIPVNRLSFFNSEEYLTVFRPFSEDGKYPLILTPMELMKSYVLLKAFLDNFNDPSLKELREELFEKNKDGLKYLTEVVNILEKYLKKFVEIGGTLFVDDYPLLPFYKEINTELYNVFREYGLKNELYHLYNINNDMDELLKKIEKYEKKRVFVPFSSLLFFIHLVTNYKNTGYLEVFCTPLEKLYGAEEILYNGSYDIFVLTGKRDFYLPGSIVRSGVEDGFLLHYDPDFNIFQKIFFLDPLAKNKFSAFLKSKRNELSRLYDDYELQVNGIVDKMIEEGVFSLEDEDGEESDIDPLDDILNSQSLSSQFYLIDLDTGKKYDDISFFGNTDPYDKEVNVGVCFLNNDNATYDCFVKRKPMSNELKLFLRSFYKSLFPPGDVASSFGESYEIMSRYRGIDLLKKLFPWIPAGEGCGKAVELEEYNTGKKHLFKICKK